MSTATMTVAHFLLARIAEDEADAMVGWRWKALPAGEYARLQARVLAECEAKRRIVERYVKIQGRTQDGDLDERLTLGWVLEQMALPYADRPDYREEWKP